MLSNFPRSHSNNYKQGEQIKTSNKVKYIRYLIQIPFSFLFDNKLLNCISGKGKEKNKEKEKEKKKKGETERQRVFLPSTPNNGVPREGSLKNDLLREVFRGTRPTKKVF